MRRGCWVGGMVLVTLLLTACEDTSSQARTGKREQKPASQADTTAGSGGHVWRMKKAEVKQMIGWDAMPQWGIQAAPQREVDALTMLVPVDWQFQGGVRPEQQKDCNMTVGRLSVIAQSPDKKAGLIALPAHVTVWTNDRSVGQAIQQDNQQFARMQMCQMEQPKPLAQRMPELVQALGKDLQASGPMEPVPGVADKLQAAVQQANAQLAQQGVQLTVEAGRVPVRNTSGTDDGDGYLTVMQVIRAQRLPSGGTLWTVDLPMQVATYAPHGQYAQYDAMFRAMLDSIAVDPAYAQACLQVGANLQSIKMQTKQRLNQIQQQMAMDNANAARQQAAIRQDTQNYASHVYSSVAAHRSAALEHSSQQFSLYMGDQAQYRDPNGGIVQLPSGSTHAWASSTGNTNEYILTDSASFNPNGQVGSAGWTQMQQVR